MKNVHNVLHERFKLQYEYLGEEKIVNKITPLVSVVVATYRHARFIAQCLDGIVNQVTKFPIEVIVGEDGSDDGTTELCIQYAEKYPNLIRLFIRDRSLSQYRSAEGNVIRFNGVWNRMSARGKYIAMCEGDDYWIDPLKLQKQVDFLEANPEYGMCYTNFNIYRQDSGKMEYDVFTSRNRDFPIRYNTPEEFVLRKGYVCPPSWVFRKECLPPEDQNIKSLDGTFVMFTHFLCTTKVYGMDDTTAVYRVLSESASHSMDYSKMYVRAKNLLETQYKLIDYYGLNPKIKKQCEIDFYKENLVQFVLHNRKDDIKQAKKVLAGYCGRREKILFLLSSIYGGRLLLKCVYNIYKSR